MRNPPWTREELILALDLYFRAGRQPLYDDHPEVIQLSRLLKQMPIYPEPLRQGNFRNLSGITMKIANFMALDPEYSGVGLRAGGKLDQIVWDEFSNNPDFLRTVADTIKSFEGVNYSIESPNEETYSEGGLLFRFHVSRERNKLLVSKKKSEVLLETNKLACEVCDFDFAEIYGDIGHEFAECHHLVPLSELKPNTKIKTSDLAIVCANCHRMLHKTHPILTVEELREIVQTRRLNRQDLRLKS